MVDPVEMEGTAAPLHALRRFFCCCEFLLTIPPPLQVRHWTYNYKVHVGLQRRDYTFVQSSSVQLRDAGILLK